MGDESTTTLGFWSVLTAIALGVHWGGVQPWCCWWCWGFSRERPGFSEQQSTDVPIDLNLKTGGFTHMTWGHFL